MDLEKAAAAAAEDEGPTAAAEMPRGAAWMAASGTADMCSDDGGSVDGGSDEGGREAEPRLEGTKWGPRWGRAKP